MTRSGERARSSHRRQVGGGRDPRLRRLALRRLSYVTPANVGKVLRHDRYWTADFCGLFLEHGELRRLHAPVEAKRLLGHLPELLERVGVGERPEQFADEAELSSLRVQAWSLLADCERLLDRPIVAQQSFDKAQHLAASVSRISYLAVAELYRRRAALAVEAGGFDLALDSLVTCRELLESCDRVDGVSKSLAETLLMLGALLGSDASRGLPELAKALAYAALREAAGEIVFDSALDMLERRLDENPVSPGALERVGYWLKQARRQPFSRHDALRRYRLLWGEGRVLSALGIARLAERRLMRVWQQLAGASEPLLLALATLDLVLLDVGRDDRRSAARRLEATMQRLPPSGCSEELPELLRQARSATFTSLQVFRRRLARQVPIIRAPRALVPRRRSAAGVSWPLPSFFGALRTECLEDRLTSTRVTASATPCLD